MSMRLVQAASCRTNVLHFRMRLSFYFRCETFLNGRYDKRAIENFVCGKRNFELFVRINHSQQCSVSPKMRVVAELAARLSKTLHDDVVKKSCVINWFENWVSDNSMFGQSDGNARPDTTNRSSSCEPCDFQSIMAHRRWPLRAFVIIESKTNAWGRQLMRMTAVSKWNGTHLSVIGR